MDNLFDSAHADALERIKIEVDKIFLQKQGEPGRSRCLVGVYKKLAEKARLRKFVEWKRD